LFFLLSFSFHLVSVPQCASARVAAPAVYSAVVMFSGNYFTDTARARARPFRYSANYGVITGRGSYTRYFVSNNNGARDRDRVNARPLLPPSRPALHELRIPVSAVNRICSLAFAATSQLAGEAINTRRD